MADIYSATLNTVKFVCGPIWGYLKTQYQYKDYLEAFNDRKEELCQLRERIQSKLNTELQEGRKIARPDVVTWLTAAGQEMSRRSVEDEVSQSGCLSSRIFRTRILTRRTAEFNRIYVQGERMYQVHSLVDDDYPSIVCDDIQIYAVQKGKLQCKLQDVKSRLHTQLQDPWKIEMEGVKLWLRNVEEITGLAATSFENQFNNVPHGGDFSKRVKEWNQQLEELLNDRAVRSESLVVDDYSQNLGGNEMQSFEEWKDKLEGKHRDVKEKLTTELRQDPGKIVTKHVKQWLQEVEDIIIPDASDVQNQLNSRRPPYLASLVNRVKKLIQKMEELCKGDQLPESLVVDDPSTPKLELLAPELQGSASDAVKAEIGGHLMGDETTKIGVWGMGGIGKTTIMKHVYNRLLSESRFKKVIWVTVSQTFDVRRIQQEIASSLGENLSEHQSTDVRAATLSKMLETRKPCVVILDDVWRSFDLEEVGIPQPRVNDSCKLLLTTRSKEVAREMGCAKIEIKTLSPEASLNLFNDIVGDVALSEDGDIKETLKLMVEECDGLPLAIKVVAGGMKGIFEPHRWRAALNQLRQGRRKDVYSKLKFSYDWLGDQIIQHCFLHCALYPEDHKIPKEELIEYWIDEELIDVMQTRQEMKDEGHAILNKLEENCLLEFTRGWLEKDCVRMHDLVRDMAIDITRSSSPRFLVNAGVGLKELPEQREWEENLSKVSLMSNHIKDIPSSMPSPRCPILTTLLLYGNYFSTIPEHFFEHMPELKVLDLSYNKKLRSLPSSVSKLVKLTTLLLRGCWSLKEVPSLSNLTALKKLDLWGAELEEVPHGLEMLLNLKYLDIRRLRGGRGPTGWKRLVSEILPNLSKLQHLGLDPVVPVEGGQLGGIWPKLENFYGGFRTWSDMCIFLSKRQKSLYHYNIYVGNPNNPYNDNDDIYLLKYINIYDINICGETGSIPSDVQMLEIRRCNGMRSLNAISGFQDVFDLQRCEIKWCREVEYVFSGLNQLSKLKKLELWYLENLKGLFDSEAPPPPLAVFSSLEEISIIDCPKIKKLFPTTLQYLPNLKAISIRYCSQLEEIMVASSEEEEGRVIHAKLEYLNLKDLPMLRSISGLTVASVFDSLKDLCISRCPNLDMEYVFRGKFKFNSLRTIKSMELEGLQSLKSIFHEEADESIAFGAPLSGMQTISFPLIELRVKDCPQLKKIFPHAVQVGSFQNIKRIEVKGCDRLEEIMAASSETEEDQSEPILPKLKKMSLIELPVLRRICSALLVPDSLQELTIEDCPNLSWESLFGLHAELPRELYFLSLKGVRNLESVFDEEASDSLAFWRLPPAAASTFALQFITVANCPQLKRIFSHGGLLDYFQKLGLDSLRWLTIEDCPNLIGECLFSSQMKLPQTLSRIRLKGVLNIQSMFDDEATLNLATTSFSLEEIWVEDCPQLKRIFPHAGLLDYFQNVRSIDVIGCDELEEIVSSNSEAELLKVTRLLKLERLHLCNLPKLKRVCTSTSGWVCESLKKLTISGCTELRRFPLHLPNSGNGQLSRPPRLREIELSDKEKEWWESLEWDQPNAKDVLARFCKFK